MVTVRLTCHVSAPGDEDLPADDDHPFQQAIDDLADAIAASLVERGVDPDTLAPGENEHGSLLTMSSDAPAWAAYFWLYLPEDGAAQAALLPVILDYLSRAKEAVPDAAWKVTLGEESLIWDAGRFRLPA
jgi:hypothetical protein